MAGRTNGLAEAVHRLRAGGDDAVLHSALTGIIAVTESAAGLLCRIQRGSAGGVTARPIVRVGSEQRVFEALLAAIESAVQSQAPAALTSIDLDDASVLVLPIGAATDCLGVVAVWLETRADIESLVDPLAPLLLIAEAGLRSAGLEVDDRRAEREASMTALTDTRITGIVTSDRRGRILLVNKAVEEMFGWKQDELVGSNLTKLMPADQRRLHSEHVGRYVDSRRPTVLDRVRVVTAMRKDRTTFRCELHVSEAGIGDDMVLVGLLADLTQRERLEHEIERVHKIDALEVIAAQVAHDFNNVLTVVNGTVASALRLRVQDPEVRSHLEEIESAGAQGRRLVRMLRTHTSNHKSTQVFSLSSQIRKMGKLINYLIPENVEMEDRLKTGLPAIRADVAHVEQVLVSLLMNARDALPNRGVIALRTYEMAVDAADVETYGAQPGRYVALELEDTGVGMPPEVLLHALDAFFSTKTDKTNPGLGLWSVRRLLCQNDGGLALHSTEGMGTRVTTLWPVAEHVAQEPDVAARSSDRLLLVEDNAQVLTYLESTLRKAGYDPILARSADQAVALAGEDPVALLIHGHPFLPREGPALATRLRASRPHMKALVLSRTYPEVHTPAVRYLLKPFSPEEFLEVVGALLPLPSMAKNTGVDAVVSKDPM